MFLFLTKKFLFLTKNNFLLCILLFVSLPLKADISVIVNTANSNTLDKVTLRKLFLGKMEHFPDGSPATPLAHPEEEIIAQAFNLVLLNRNKVQYKSYWARIIFTGQGHPPETAYNDEEIINHIKNNPSAISYINSTALTNEVKEVIRLQETLYYDAINK
jgi:ABC-type phosphate transport system substrate-binding protein